MSNKPKRFKPTRRALKNAQKSITTRSHPPSPNKLPMPSSPVRSTLVTYTQVDGKLQSMSSERTTSNTATTTFSDEYEYPGTSNGTLPESKFQERRFQGASEFMRPFLGRLGEFIPYVLRKEEPPSRKELCECNISIADTRCNDCFHDAPTCQICFFMKHKRIPFHWARVWNDEKGFFEQRDISELQFVITLGHNGESCPLADYDYARAIRIIDINGIHETRIQYCHCNSRLEPFDQLMSAGLFPATATNPDTAFTFSLLEIYNLDSLISKKSVFDFAKALRRRTDPAFPEWVPNVYPQYLRVMRVWRVLQMFKQSGLGHDIDDAMELFAPGWGARSLIQQCFACPQPGFNMQEEVDDEELKHLETLFLSADGHFGLQRKDKNEDPDDIALTEDMGLFPLDRVYAEYENKVEDSTEKTTCAHLKAANMQNKAKFIGLVVSGVIAITCARHSCFLRGGMANLTHGEKFNRTDYALAGALSFLVLVTHIVLTYDIACQYKKNLGKRFRENFIGTPFENLCLEEVVDRIICLVPKMHLKGHIPDCQYAYSLNFTPNVGRTYGEAIKGTWAEAKQAGGMTREMNAGHRVDTLNALQNDWNVGKMQNLFSSLFRQLTNARSQARRKLDFYKGQSKIVGQELVEAWSKLSTKSVKKGNYVESVYRLKEDKVPGQVQIYREMLEAEAAAEAKNQQTSSVTSKSSASQLLNEALKLQNTQRIIKVNTSKHDLTDADRTSIAKQRAALCQSLKRWREKQELLCPSIMDLVLEQRFGQPEDEQLFVPSDLDVDQRKKHGLGQMSNLELRLRKGEANDAVRCLRMELYHVDALWAMKNKKANHNVGTEKNLRSLKDIKNAEEKIQKLATKYRQCRSAMMQLGMSSDDSLVYRELRDEDLYLKNVVQPHALGDGSKTESWLWSFGAAASLSAVERTEFENECHRVKWFRSRADMQRWQEEVEILSEEFRRAIRACEKMELVWKHSARTSESKGQRFKVYACQQAEICKERAKEGRERFEAAGGTWPAKGVRLVDHVRAERPSWDIDWHILREVDKAEEEALERMDILAEEDDFD